jgi:hypothetical protein
MKITKKILTKSTIAIFAIFAILLLATIPCSASELSLNSFESGTNTIRSIVCTVNYVYDDYSFSKLIDIYSSNDESSKYKFTLKDDKYISTFKLENVDYIVSLSVQVNINCPCDCGDIKTWTHMHRMDFKDGYNNIDLVFKSSSETNCNDPDDTYVWFNGIPTVVKDYEIANFGIC